MEYVLLTGATGFVGYHIAKLLNARGIRPRALVRASSNVSRLQALDVDLVEGDIEDFASVRQAMRGIDTLFHAAGLVSTDPRDRQRLYQVNVQGTRHALDAAAGAGVSKVVVTSSVSAVGASTEPVPLDEDADWKECGILYPYSVTKRQAEEDALQMAGRGLPVVVVNPSVVIGPGDYLPTPGGRVLRDVAAGRIPGYIHTGVAYVDVRDLAEGHLAAAERGKPGRRYILSGHNVTLEQFFRMAAGIAGVRPPRWKVPYPVVYAAAAITELWSAVSGRPPGFTRSTIRVAGRYSWYDTSRAADELGWRPRPLEESLEDSIAWFGGAADIQKYEA